MAKKWVIVRDQFRIANVEYHKELVGSDPKEDVKGGGSFEFYEDEKELHLFGTSFDFGGCHVEDFEGINWPNKVEGYDVIFKDVTWERHKVKSKTE